MKKSTRFFVVGGLLCVLAGGIIMLVTGCIGGISMMHTIATEYTYSDWNFGHGHWHWNDYGFEYHDGTNHDADLLEETISLDESENEIRSLRIYNIDGVDLDVIQGGTGSMTLSVDGVGIKYAVDDGCLVIRSGDNWFADGGEIVLSVPGNMQWENVDIEFGAGDLDIEGMQTGRMNLDAGASHASLERIKADEMAISVGAGEVDAEQVEISGDINISVGFGEVDFSGVVDGDLDFSCGMGNIEFESERGFYEDYNYDISCAAGNVEIEDYHFAGVSFTKQIDNHSHKTMNIECGMGNISVSFD